MLEGTGEPVIVWEGGVNRNGVLRRVGLRKHKPLGLMHNFEQENIWKMYKE